MVFAPVGYGQTVRKEIQTKCETGICDDETETLAEEEPADPAEPAETEAQKIEEPADPAEPAETEAQKIKEPADRAGTPDVALDPSVEEEAVGEKSVKQQDPIKIQPRIDKIQVINEKVVADKKVPKAEPVAVKKGFLSGLNMPWWGWAIGGALLIAALAGNQDDSEEGGSSGSEGSNQGTVTFTW